MSRPTVAELALRYPALDDVETDPRRDMAAEVYSLWTQFRGRAFNWEEWAPGRSGVDGHREWRFFLRRLNVFEVPHEFEPGPDSQDKPCMWIRFTYATWAWQAREGGLMCSQCWKFFTPDKPTQRAAWLGKQTKVRCEVCS